MRVQVDETRNQDMVGKLQAGCSRVALAGRPGGEYFPDGAGLDDDRVAVKDSLSRLYGDYPACLDEGDG